MSRINTSKWALLVDQVMVSGCTLATQLLIAAGLGVAQYGRFSVLVLVQLFLLSLQQAGLTGMYQIIYPGIAPFYRKQYVAGVWTMEWLFLAVIAVSGLAGYAFFRTRCTFPEWIAGLVNVLLFLLQDFFRRIFITESRIRPLMTIDLLNNLLQVGALFLLFLMKWHSLLPVLWICGLSFVPGLAWALIVFASFPRLGTTGHVLKHHGTETVWMTGSTLLQWFSGNFYIIAAGWWLGAATLGILRLGQYVFGVLNVLLQAAEGYLLPRAAAIAAVPGETIRYLKAAYYKIVLSAGFFLLAVVLLAKPVIAQIHMPNSGELTFVLYGMSFFYLFVAGGYPIRIALRTLKLSRFFFTGYVLTALFGFSTAYLFIHQWSLMGVIAGLLLSQLLMLGYWICILQHKYSVLWK